jgi:hypothetical protein
MPINHIGEIAYQPASPTGGIRLQADPPVCNRCWHEITPQNFGQVFVVGQTPSLSRFEFIECTACTTVRAGDPEATLFWIQHQRCVPLGGLLVTYPNMAPQEGTCDRTSFALSN